MPTLLNDENSKNVGAVVVAIDGGLSVYKLTRAINYLSNPECLFIGTNMDTLYPKGDSLPIVPLDGTLISTIEIATGRKATVLGKPDPHFAEIISLHQKINPQRTLFIGDQLHTDIQFGNSSGFQTLLVETGAHKREDVNEYLKNGRVEDEDLIPNIIIPKLSDLLPYLKKMLNNK